ncbi:serine/threonine protein kinase [Natronocella acetinitrilica]|uniref:Serine/threonine protein kinase n=1 Tax=Natronocella acetinitrilica TaxID=414046 RepID=A0AAE3G2P6_9GAMM|nr:serine/threonine-protein kinase [Natronocella acetinitrilica]MCP1673919.1 serine/threonine protein kinase [Natronocella acetinitrilica]
MSEHRDDDKTRVAGTDDDTTRVGNDDATRIAPDDATRVASSESSRPDRTSGTASDWARPETWSAPSAGSMGPGAVIKQRFVLEELIGQGGMGAVYRARDLRKEEAQDSEPHVAIKLLSDEFRQHPDSLVALQREAKKAQVLAHPNIVTVYDFDRDGTQVYMTMEYLQGDPLDVVIRRRGAGGGLPRSEALHIIDRMSRGLAYAHQQGIVHSDFKPGNVFLTKDNNAKILDFGIARAARVQAAGEGDETRFDPATIGAITPAYASAEMLAGEVPEAADDVYALGCVAYELLTGRHPYLDDSGRKLPADEVARQGIRPTPPKDVPKRVVRAVLRAIAPSRDERFPNAGMFLEAVKPPARLGRKVMASLAALGLVAAVSWWMLIRETDMMVTLDDLPTSLEESRALIIQGDRYLAEGDIPQAHRHYTLAWERVEEQEEVSGRDRNRLRVLVDRHTDQVLDHYIREAEREDLDDFSLELLRISLESLERSELGTRRDRLQRALDDVNARLD